MLGVLQEMVSKVDSWMWDRRYDGSVSVRTRAAFLDEDNQLAAYSFTLGD